MSVDDYKTWIKPNVNIKRKPSHYFNIRVVKRENSVISRQKSIVRNINKSVDNPFEQDSFDLSNKKQKRKSINKFTTPGPKKSHYPSNRQRISSFSVSKLQKLTSSKKLFFSRQKSCERITTKRKQQMCRYSISNQQMMALRKCEEVL